jgi:hypothetical protein
VIETETVYCAVTVMYSSRALIVDERQNNRALNQNILDGSGDDPARLKHKVYVAGM